MVSLYEILEVHPTASQEEIKRAYKSMAMKTHPDRVPPEQKSQAEARFQKVSAAYEVLSNETARREYDLTGRMPSSAASGNSPAASSASSQSQGRSSPFFTPFPFQPFGFGDSLFNDRFNTFNSPFFTSSRAGTWDPFENDPFFNPAAGMRGGRSPQSMFREVEDMIQDFMGNTGNGPFGRQSHGGSLFDPPPFPFAGFQQRSLPRGGEDNGGRFDSRSFVQTSSSKFENGRWVTESYEESNLNGESRTRREWIDNEGVKHREETRPDGSTRYLRDGVEQGPGALPPPPAYTSVGRDRLLFDESAHSHSSSRRRNHRDRA